MIRISGHTRVYSSTANRLRALALLKKRGYNYFVGFDDVQGYGLQFYKK